MVEQMDRLEMTHVIQTADAAHQNKRLRPRTFLIPILFLAVHWLVTNIVATVFLIFKIFSQPASGNPLDSFTDLDLINQILNDNYPLITVLSAIFLLPTYLFFLLRQRKKYSR